MVLLRRRPVELLALPLGVDSLDPQTEVFFIAVTGEIFFDYPSYLERMEFLQRKIFVCEHTNKAGLDYFAAHASEVEDLRLVRRRFPDELKAKVLASVQFQIQGRLDGLVDSIYERYKDRYFAGEKVFIDITGDKFFAKISHVFPPAAIRENADAEQLKTVAHPIASTSAAKITPTSTGVVDYSSVTHKIGVDLTIDTAESRAEDNPDEYLYTIQLMDEEHKFEGSYMEVKAKVMSRDRLGWSKSILKRYLRECVTRDSLAGSPWMVRSNIAAAFSIPTRQDPETEARQAEIRGAKLAKRKKPSENDPDGKRRKVGNATGADGEDGGQEAAMEKPVFDAKRPIKYPIEDLDLDPISILDGRTLRRTKADVPALPEKPVPKRELPVPAEVFDAFIMVWNTLNIFSKPLCLSTMSIDDLAAALQHPTIEPRCLLLAEIHGALTNLIGGDTSRVLGQTTAAPLPLHLALPALDVASATSSSPVPEMEVVNPEMEDELEEEEDIDRLVRKGMKFSVKWDRMQKLKANDGRKGWERHVIGALCTRGGPLSMPNLVRILEHLFQEVESTIPPPEPIVPPTPTFGAPAVEYYEAEIVKYDPTISYLTLSIEDKIDILGYLCTLALGSKAVRTYMEECDANLTEGRRDRAEVNKERKRLLEERAAADGGKAVKVETDYYANGLGEQLMEVDQSSVKAESVVPDAMDEDEEDQLADDDPYVKKEESEDEVEAKVEGGSRTSTPSGRLSKEQRAVVRAEESARARSATKAAIALRKETEIIRAGIDEEILKNGRRDDQVEREFRRNYGVARCRPLGKDRFFNRYWWFDGVGGMSLDSKNAANHGGASYGTARLFVQGPSSEDWTYACHREGAEEVGREILRVRSVEECVVPEAALAMDEWAYFDSEEELESLQAWLNGKGVRELALKNSLAKWKGYILAGARRRESGIVDAFIHPVDSKRSTRTSIKKEEPEFYEANYLNYVNRIGRY